MNKLFLLFAFTTLLFNGCAQNIGINAEQAKVKSVLSQFFKSIELEDMELHSKVMAHDNDMVNFGTDAAEHYVGWEAWKKAHIAQWDALDEIKITSKDLVVRIHRSGEVAWFSDVTDWELTDQNESMSFKGLRFTGVLEKRNDNWVIVQIHVSVPVSGQAVEY